MLKRMMWSAVLFLSLLFLAILSIIYRVREWWDEQFRMEPEPLECDAHTVAPYAIRHGRASDDGVFYSEEKEHVNGNKCEACVPGFFRPRYRKNKRPSFFCNNCGMARI